jgi:hypothetical protein|tara:strand:+ start:372 stop:785 length:414 start_codon:yes stop_codon:yes gene_type:complete
MAWSGLWNDVHSENHSLLVNKPMGYRQVAQALRKRGMTAIREVIDTVVATTSINGGAAVSYERVAGTTTGAGNAPIGGGVVTIETVEKHAASSTVSAAEAAAVDGMVDYKKQPATYPADAAGNGSGGDNDKTWPLGT